MTDGTAFYTYDDRDQLTGEFYVDQYLDANGDFQTISSGGYAASFQPNLAYQYDTNGNRLRRSVVNLPNRFNPSHADFDPATQFEPIGDDGDSETFAAPGVTVTSTDDFETPAGAHNRIETDGTHTYAFDDQGNRTSRFIDVNGDGVLSSTDTDVTLYEWDVRNRLIEVAEYASGANALAGSNPTQMVEHIYDLHNRWIGKKVDTDGDGDIDETERYVYDGNQIVLRVTPTTGSNRR